MSALAAIHARSALSTLLVVALAAVPAAAAAQQAYKVGEHDVLRISVWAEPTLTGSYTVASAGSIEFPLIGAVKATGRTTEEIAQDVRQRLADGYIREPQVAVEVTEFNSQRIFVVGEVRTPGAVPLTGTLTLIEALTKVGSLSDSAGGELVVIRPPQGRTTSGPILQHEPGAQEVARVDVRSLQSGPTSNITLQHGDTIVVPRAETIYVIGQVNGPGSYVHERDMTILQAISRAGGVNEMGTTKRVKILRIVNGKRTELKAGLGDRLQPGDTVVVSSRWF